MSLRNEGGPSGHHNHVNFNGKPGPRPGQSKSTNRVESETILGGFDNSATSGSESDTSDSDIEILDEFLNGPINIHSHDQSLNEDPLISNGNEQENHTFYGNFEDNVQAKVGLCDQDQKMDIKIEEIMIDDDDFIKEISPTTTTFTIEDKVDDIETGDNCNMNEDNNNDKVINLNVQLEEHNEKTFKMDSQIISKKKEILTRKEVNSSGPSPEKPEEIEIKVDPVDFKPNLEEEDVDQTIKKISPSGPSQDFFYPSTEKPDEEIKSNPKPTLEYDDDEYDDLTSNKSVIFSGTLCQARLPRLADINFNLTPTSTDNNGLYKYNKNLDLNLNHKTPIDINKMSMSTTKNYESKPTHENVYKCNQNADFKPYLRHRIYSVASTKKCTGCNKKFSNYTQFIWHKYDGKLKCGNPKLVKRFEPKSKYKISNICKPGDPSRYKQSLSFRETTIRPYIHRRHSKQPKSWRYLSENTKIKKIAQRSLNFVIEERKRIRTAKIAQSKMKGSNFNQFVCDICKIARFENEVFLNLHKKLHEDPNFFSCLGKKIGCYFIGQNLEELSDHSKECKLAEYVQHKYKLECETPSKDLFHCLFASCQVLGFSAKNRLYVSKHLKIFHNFKNDKLFVCELCVSGAEYGFPNQKLLAVHVNIVHLYDKGKIKCQIKNCSRSFITFPTLTDHLVNRHHLDSNSLNLYKREFYKDEYPIFKKNYFSFCHFCKKYPREKDHIKNCIIEQSRRIVYEQNLRLENPTGKSDGEIKRLVQQWYNEDKTNRPLLCSQETKEENIIRKRLEIGVTTLKKKHLIKNLLTLISKDF